MTRRKMMTPSAGPRARAGAAVCLGTGLALVAATAVIGPANATSSTDLTKGAVFAMSNAREGNVVVAYARNTHGQLAEVGRYATKGTGSGSFEDSDNGLVLGTSRGESAPNNLIELAAGGQQLLFATNAGSNTVSVFQVNHGGLKLVDVQPSGGEKPVSVTVNRGIVYVLNSGETNDDLFDSAGNVIENCTTGKRPQVNGFTVTPGGQLHAISGSTRSLSKEAISGCAQVSFDPTGTTLIVTERFAQPRWLGQQRSSNERLDDEGVIVGFRINKRGRSIGSRIVDATGQGPFGFTFTKDNNLLTAEQFDGPAGPGRGAVTSYQLGADRRSAVRSAPSLRNGGTDTCWIVATDDAKLAFSTSFFGDGRISSYELDKVGLVRVIEDVATGEDSAHDGVAMGASDISLSSDSRYLYQLNSLNGTINAFTNNGDGTLTKIEIQTPFPQPAFGPGMGMGAPIGLVAN